MTENEAKVLLCQMYLPQFDEEEKQALTMAIQALEEIQQYRTIGTLGEIRSIVKDYFTESERLAEYKRIGTIEEFKALKEKNETLKALYEDARKEGNNLLARARENAIDDFTKRIKQKLENDWIYDLDSYEDCQNFIAVANKIAEQMKGEKL